MNESHNSLEKEKLMEELEEIQVRLAVLSWAEEEGERLLQENEELKKDPFYQPSEEAKQKFRKMLKRHSFRQKVRNVLHTSYRYSKNVAAILFAVLLVFSTSILSVRAMRTKVLNWFIQMGDQYTEIGLDEKENTAGDNINVNWVNAYAPSYIPKGFSISSLNNGKNMKSIEYKNEKEGIIVFQQMDNNANQNIDTEDAEKIEKITVQGEKGLLVNKNDLITVAWHNDTYMFTLSTKSDGLQNEEVLKIAESVILKK
jgi:hypothetical protein